MTVSRETLRAMLGDCLLDARFEQWSDRYDQGKVRDIYLLDGRRIMVTTDRQSAFDHVLGAIPLKGQVLNRIAEFWFRNTEDIVANHVVEVPHPNVTVGEELDIFPVEVVVRGYLTGSTSTSAWVNYQQGKDPYRLGLPPGLKKNHRFETPVITPTTKSHEHDEPLSSQEVVKRGLVDEGMWRQIEQIALRLFARGQQLAEEQGLILVDTKYEMGRNRDGQIALADEVHTPDSSRYWIRATYEERHSRDEEPESLDKEFLRLWLMDKGISDMNIPVLDDDIRIEVAERYISLFERVTGQAFTPELGTGTLRERIEKAIAPYFT